MNRTPAILCLVGLALCVIGFYLMMRVVVPTANIEGMQDQPIQPGTVHIDVLQQEATPRVFDTYVVLAGSGLAIFVSGLAMMLGRSRLN